MSADEPALQYRDAESGYSTQFETHSIYRWRDDAVAAMDVEDLPRLARSDRWEDRVRFAVLSRHLEHVLPDAFPCLYETATSPTQQRLLHPRPNVWVASPDAGFLHELLEPYQELWDAYTAQWGPASRRVFAVGPLDGAPTYTVRRPGSSVDEVLVETMQRHNMGVHRDTAPRAAAAWERYREARGW